MGLACFPFIILELFMSLNACLDIKWADVLELKKETKLPGSH